MIGLFTSARKRGAAICAFVVTHAWAAGAGGDPLAAVEKTVSARFSVDEVSATDLAAALSSADSSSYVLFDVREPAEFDSSHVRGARRLAPDMKGAAFEAEFGDSLEGKRLVFYCSVGYRSSILAERMQARATASGALSVANLRGGIFRWYNDGRVVFNGKDTTDAIHNYDRVWSVFVNQRPGPAAATPVPTSPVPITSAPTDSSEK